MFSKVKNLTRLSLLENALIFNLIKNNIQHNNQSLCCMALKNNVIINKRNKKKNKKFLLHQRETIT